MDIVITYVCGEDPQWQDDYARTLDVPPIEKRYRDMGTLKYLLRGIEKYMPSVERVFLAVSRDSQVPGWVNREEVHVVRHDEFIPGEYLPTFNSTAIEMFLHRIPSLGERFLYFNDDFFPVGPISEDDCFPGGRPRTGFSTILFSPTDYLKRCRNSDALSRKILGLSPSPLFVRPQHNCSPMLRSVNGKVFEMAREDILSSITTVRSPRNINQYLFLDYMLHSGIAIRQRQKAKFFSLGFRKAEDVASFILDSGGVSLLCLNDAKMPPEKYLRSRDVLLEAFQRKFPQKSRFEV